MSLNGNGTSLLLEGGIFLIADEESASELIARESFKLLAEAGAGELDVDRLTLCIGLFCYCAAFCIPSFDAKSFRRLFVLAWFKYFSTVSIRRSTY